jgi:hypothetical protein
MGIEKKPRTTYLFLKKIRKHERLATEIQQLREEALESGFPSEKQDQTATGYNGYVI